MFRSPHRCPTTPPRRHSGVGDRHRQSAAVGLGRRGGGNGLRKGLELVVWEFWAQYV